MFSIPYYKNILKKTPNKQKILIYLLLLIDPWIVYSFSVLQTMFLSTLTTYTLLSMHLGEKRFCFLVNSKCHPSTAAAAAKSLQSCPILCDPIDGSPPGSPIPGILQARTLERVAISLHVISIFTFTNNVRENLYSPVLIKSYFRK